MIDYFINKNQSNYHAIVKKFINLGRLLTVPFKWDHICLYNSSWCAANIYTSHSNSIIEFINNRKDGGDSKYCVKSRRPSERIFLV